MRQRPSWDETFMDICRVIAKRSTCLKLQTAAVLVKDTNIVSIGYNGTPSKMTHCNVHFSDTPTEVFQQIHHDWSVANELHAEMNALLQCYGDTRNSTMYTIYSPCINCAKCIVAAKIARVVYIHEYKRTFTESELFLKLNGVSLVNHSSV